MLYETTRQEARTAKCNYQLATRLLTVGWFASGLDIMPAFQLFVVLYAVQDLGRIHEPHVLQ